MPEPLVTLNGAESLLMCPVEVFKSTHLFPSLCFGPTGGDGSEKRQVCCVCQGATPHLFLPKTPLVFNLLGQIAVEDCFLTAQGRLRPGTDEEPVASCWLQPRPNVVSDITWRGILPTIEAIVDKFGGIVDTTELLTAGTDGKLRLQVIWQEDGGDLPIFDEYGIQHVPASISQVPFGEPVHAVFSIEFVHDRRAGMHTVVASLFAIVKA